MNHKKINIAEDTSLIITTYNKPDYLELALKGVLRQRTLPSEVVIADDGSTDETKDLIVRYRNKFIIPLIHSWIPDEGFRLAKSRNTAITKSHGDYLIMIDSDIIMSPHFVKDHLLLRERGEFINGNRTRLNDIATIRCLKSKNPHFSIFTPGLVHPLTLIRSPFLHYWTESHLGTSHVGGYNLSFWKDDVLKINGFEELATAWGYEDIDFALRLCNNGIRCKNIKHLANCVHLDHGEYSCKALGRHINAHFEEDAITNNKKRAIDGIDKYL